MTRTEVEVVRSGQTAARSDRLATEEPMEIRLRAGGSTERVAVTMRTPGSDFELAAGFLYSEGIVADRHVISSISYCIDRAIDPEQHYNIVNVDLVSTQLPQLDSLERHFFTSSACGICGRATLESLELRGCAVAGPGPELTADVVASLPERLRSAQGVFESTGGLHAAAIFAPHGELVALREDVGRHNAVDKVVGWALLNDRLPLHDHVLMVSGRASYEIMQKALAARIAVVCAVSAPSSLAVDVAKQFDMTLIGFLREQRFNIYNGSKRIQLD